MMKNKSWGFTEPDPGPETVFEFSSVEHSGVGITVPGHPNITITNFFVRAERERQALKNMMGHTVDVVSGQVYIWGNIQPIPEDIENFFAQTIHQDLPFDVVLQAYDPISNIDYQARIKGCWITDTDRGEFQAVSIDKWNSVASLTARLQDKPKQCCKEVLAI
jgi:hypothetical protein